MITYATIEGNKPVAIFDTENELKMNCVWIDDEANKSVKLWTKGRSYRVTPDGEYKKLGLKKRDTTEEEKVGMELETKLEE